MGHSEVNMDYIIWVNYVQICSACNAEYFEKVEIEELESWKVWEEHHRSSWNDSKVGL